MARHVYGEVFDCIIVGHPEDLRGCHFDSCNFQGRAAEWARRMIAFGARRI